MNAATGACDGTKVAGAVAQGPTVLAEMMRLALAIRDLIEGESDEGRVALGFAALNRMRRSEVGMESAAGTRDAARDIFDPALCRALAVACLVLSGGIADPTDGATHFHRHTEKPKWARSATPKALIGRHIFYRLERQPAA